ncbi:MAG: hypothetical protein K2M48_00360 [Clostridiales bacterium]|nr:hypothetical protein [Clostridiales bacterium]
MGIKQKFKSLWEKLRHKNSPEKSKVGRDRTDAEISAEDVLVEEIYPAGKVTVRRKKEIEAAADITEKSSGRTTRARVDNRGKVDKVCGKAEVKPTVRAGRSRPTNGSYKMIDPSDDSADTGKS